MSTQLSFLDDSPSCHTHRRDPQTAKAAAVRHEPQAATNRAKVLTAVRNHPGLTAPEYGEVTGLGHVEAQRRLSDLMRAKLIHQGEPAACKGHRGLLVTWWLA